MAEFDYTRPIGKWPNNPETRARLRRLIDKMGPAGANTPLGPLLAQLEAAAPSRPQVTDTRHWAPRPLAPSMWDRAEKRSWKKLLSPTEHKELREYVNRWPGKSEQLRMLAPAGELKSITPGDWAAYANLDTPSHELDVGLRNIEGETIDDLWRRKLDESKAPVTNNPRGQHGAGLHRSIAKEGVRDAVGIIHQQDHDAAARWRPRIDEGHHRIAAAADINPKMEVPIQNFVPEGISKKQVERIVPNKEIVKQLMKFAEKYGKGALRRMMKL